MITPTLATAVYLYTQNSEYAVGIRRQTDRLNALRLGAVQEAAKVSGAYQVALSLRVFIRQAQLRVEKIIEEVETAADKLALLQEAAALQERAELAREILEVLNGRQ